MAPSRLQGSRPAPGESAPAFRAAFCAIHSSAPRALPGWPLSKARHLFCQIPQICRCWLCVAPVNVREHLIHAAFCFFCREGCGPLLYCLALRQLLAPVRKEVHLGGSQCQAPLAQGKAAQVFHCLLSLRLGTSSALQPARPGSQTCQSCFGMGLGPPSGVGADLYSGTISSVATRRNRT